MLCFQSNFLLHFVLGLHLKLFFFDFFFVYIYFGKLEVVVLLLWCGGRLEVVVESLKLV
jgi:hypothetical protein